MLQNIHHSRQVIDDILIDAKTESQVDVIPIPRNAAAVQCKADLLLNFVVQITDLFFWKLKVM